MAESQRTQAAHHRVSDADRKQTLRERLFLVTFGFGAISLVSGMLWLANGLSENFSTASATFIVFVVAAVATGASSITSRVMTR